MVEGKGRGRRLRMRWEDCVKRDLERVGGVWRTTAPDGRWRLVIENTERIVRRGKKRESKDDSNHGEPHP